MAKYNEPNNSEIDAAETLLCIGLTITNSQGDYLRDLAGYEYGYSNGDCKDFGTDLKKALNEVFKRHQGKN